MHDLASNAEMNRRLTVTVAQAASVLKLHPEVVRRRCKAKLLDCRKHPRSQRKYPDWLVSIPESAIQESSYIAVGGFDGSIGLDFLLLEKIEDLAGEAQELGSDSGGQGERDEMARLKGEICTLLKAMLS